MSMTLTRAEAGTASAVVPVVSAATLISLMNYTAPIGTLRETAGGVAAGPEGQTWILSSISLGLAALLLVIGSLADDFGRRRVFVAGAWLLAASSIMCALATNTGVFVAGRIVQGGASAALLAGGLGLIGHAYPAGAARVRATGIWGAMIGAGIATGPVAAAALTGAGPIGWRWWYWVAAAGAVALGVAAVALLPESRAETPRGIDLPGVLTLGGGLAALLAAMTEGRGGWGRPSVAVLFAVAAVLLGGFVVAEAARKNRMLDLALFRGPAFVISTTGALFTGLSIIGQMSYLPVILAHRLGASTMDGALAIFLWSGIAFAVSLQARRLRFAASRQLAGGLVLGAAGSLLLIGMDGWTRVLVALAVAGIGSGLVNAALGRLAVESVPADRVAMGSGANNTARYVGASIGVAMVIALAAHGTGIRPDPAFEAAAALAVAGALIALVLGRRPSPGSR